MSGNTYVPPGNREPIIKHPSESLVFFGDFANLLPSGASLTGTPTVSVDSGITAGSPSISGTKVNVRISGGTAGTDYDIDIVCADDASNTHVIEGIIEVRANG